MHYENSVHMDRHMRKTNNSTKHDTLCLKQYLIIIVVSFQVVLLQIISSLYKKLFTLRGPSYMILKIDLEKTCDRIE